MVLHHTCAAELHGNRLENGSGGSFGESPVVAPTSDISVFSMVHFQDQTLQQQLKKEEEEETPARRGLELLLGPEAPGAQRRRSRGRSRQGAHRGTRAEPLSRRLPLCSAPNRRKIRQLQLDSQQNLPAGSIL